MPRSFYIGGATFGRFSDATSLATNLKRRCVKDTLFRDNKIHSPIALDPADAKFLIALFRDYLPNFPAGEVDLRIAIWTKPKAFDTWGDSDFCYWIKPGERKPFPVQVNSLRAGRAKAPKEYYFSIVGELGDCFHLTDRNGEVQKYTLTEIADMARDPQIVLKSYGTQEVLTFEQVMGEVRESQRPSERQPVAIPERGERTLSNRSID